MSIENYKIVVEKTQEDEEIVEERAGHTTLITGTQMERPLRHLSGQLKEVFGEKYKTSIINLGTKTGEYEGQYPKEVISNVIEKIIEENSEVIGVTLIDYEYERIAEMISKIVEDERIKELGAKLVVGGPSAIEHPNRALAINGVDVVAYSQAWNFPDIVRVLADGGELDKLPGLLLKLGINEDGTPIGLSTFPPEVFETLADVGLADESLLDTYHLYKGNLVNTAESGGAFPVEHHQRPHKHTGILVTSYGCPNDCEFCHIARNQTIMEKIHGIKNAVKVKFLDAESSISAIENFLEHNPNTEYVMFNDNDFTARGEVKIKEFCERYKEKIGLPFYFQGSPNTISPVKLKMLFEAGLDTVDTGVQGSWEANVAAGYDRNCSNEQVVRVAEGVAPFLEKRDSEGIVIEDGGKVVFDWINNNPVLKKEHMYSSFSLMQAIDSKIDVLTEGAGSWNAAIHNLTLDEEIELSKRYAEVDGKISENLDTDTQALDYHNATVEKLYSLDEGYLNVLMEWFGGVHDPRMIGRIDRNADDFINRHELVIEKYPKIERLFRNLANEKSTSWELFLDDQVYSFFNDKNNTSALEFLRELEPNLPPINYSYHRPDRNEYDMEWAEKQVQ